MGQYHKIVNITKKEVLKPHAFTDGYKLLEFGTGGLTMTALAVLLACSNGRGGGDLHSDNPIVGTWAGDRIAIIGDYANKDDFEGLTEADIKSIWGDDDGDDSYKDISREVLKALCDDGYLKDRLLESVVIYDYNEDWSEFFTPVELAEAKLRLEKEREARRNQ